VRQPAAARPEGVVGPLCLAAVAVVHLCPAVVVHRQ